ncbi:MAG TPA: glycosyl hydrolase family 79 C-terminal domain-containing protein [Solirubrobacteraceae bacterium]|nr:glycosyl hydrolase family 79 C-terminal domain-containing protein [Solirubrobacteraceae bacterium]
MTARRWTLLLAALIAGALLAGCDAAGPPEADVTVRVGAPVSGLRAIPPGFVGVSMEFQSAALVAGPASDPNTVVQQLLAGLAPGQAPVIRIGGDSTDHAWYPAPGLHDPDRHAFPITRAWLASLRTLADAIHARMLLGINLEANNPRLSAVEARALVNGIGRGSIQGLEVGNEPSLYAALYWYETASGQKVFGRPPGWDAAQYLAQFAAVARRLPRSVPLAGPALGSHTFMAEVLGALLRSQPRLTTITYHSYPLNRCFTPPSAPTYPTIAHLLSPSSSRGLAAGDRSYARAALAHGDVFRVDELNSVACSGKTGVSNTFASALWMLDTLFAMAREGVTGVNVHTLPSAAYRLFTVHRSAGRWSATVAPEYYALLAFTRAAPPGSRLLGAAASGSPQVRVWATAGPGRTIRIVLINVSANRSHVVRVTPSGADGPAGLQRLTAPGLTATGGVSLGGRRFAHFSSTGRLAAPQRRTVVRTSGGYVIRLPQASAALLTIPVTSR